MKEFNGEIEYKNKKYKLPFNLNVMEEIQEEYESLEKWGKLTDGSEGEPNAKAVTFGFTAMINEGLAIESEETGEEFVPLSRRKVARMISEIGLDKATEKLNTTVVESTKSDEKNA